MENKEEIEKDIQDIVDGYFANKTEMYAHKRISSGLVGYLKDFEEVRKQADPWVIQNEILLIKQEIKEYNYKGNEFPEKLNKLYALLLEYYEGFGYAPKRN